MYHKRGNQREKWHEKRKAMKTTTWDSDSESKREDDSAYICFMTKGMALLR